MAFSAGELAQKERFESAYCTAQSTTMLAIERSVCGCNYGGTSWTTKSQAEELGAALGLAAGVCLLELGSGSGWPGLFMAKASGCEVVLVDLPVTGLKIARERANGDDMGAQVTTIAASAAQLPFPQEEFDAIIHSDLLCCLVQKRAVLAESRRVIQREGRMAFTVIFVSPGVSKEEHAEGVAAGPDFVDTDTNYRTLLGETGWIITDLEDVTETYAASCELMLQEEEARENELIELFGAVGYAEKSAYSRSRLSAAKEGLLRRELFVVEPEPAMD